jgi:SAM-dependent methyltransferase
MEEQERLSRRDAFGEAADAYDTERPGYPIRSIKAALRLASLGAGASVLEIGCGTGQATEPFARAGLHVHALEPDPALAVRARQRLARFPNVAVEECRLEELLTDRRFDAVLAATSLHWVDPAKRWASCARLLAPGGHVMLLTNVHPRPYTGFFARVQEVYDSVVPEWGGRPAVDVRTEDSASAVRDASPDGFAVVGDDACDWRETYTAARYLRLLSTYSDHRRLEPEQRESLFAEIGALIETEYGGEVDRPYRTLLRVLRMELPT